MLEDTLSCSTCLEILPDDYFPLNRAQKARRCRHSECKSCKHDRYDDKRDEISKAGKEKRAQETEAERLRRCERTREYLKSRKEAVQESRRRRLAKAREEQRLWRDNNRDVYRAYMRRASLKRKCALLNLPSFPYEASGVYLRDGGICHITAEHVPEILENGRRGYHIDHLIPLQVEPQELLEFGIEEHPGDVPWNVAVAKPSANIGKKNRLCKADVDMYLFLLSRADPQAVAYSTDTKREVHEEAA